jgi:hypothetical protein
MADVYKEQAQNGVTFIFISCISIYTYTLNMINCLIYSVLLYFLYTLYVHFIYTKRTLTVHFSGDECGFSVGKWRFLGRKVVVSR